MNNNTNRESPLLRAYKDFLSSRESILCTRKTMIHYRYTTGNFVQWLDGETMDSPDKIVASHVRRYLNGVRDRGVQDSTLHAHARGIKTFLRFLHEEGYITTAVPIRMPRLDRKRLPYLEANEVYRLANACRTPRDKALVLLMVDTGLRLEETAALRWGDLDVRNGLVEVRRGKGGKARTTVVGEFGRQALQEYRRWWVQTFGGIPSQTDPLWPNERTGERLTNAGISLAIRRVAEAAGLKASPHMFRRTFATLALRAGMNPFHLQALLGHTTLEMTRRYVQILDEDLRKAHGEFGPVDRLLGAGRRTRRGKKAANGQ